MFNRLIRKIHKNKLDPEELDKTLLQNTADELMKGMQEGYGLNLVNLAYDSPDFLMMRNLTENVYLFSGAKTYQQLRHLTDLLVDESGKVKSFSAFKSDALAVWKDYNQDWLRTEYNLAIASSQMAARWSEFQQNADLMPNLRYRTAGDGRVRREHQALDGVVKPLNDPFWDSYYPPNDFGCRCDTEQTDSPAIPKGMNLPKLKPMFRNNVGKSGQMFPDTHPYYEMLTNEARKRSIQIRNEALGKKGYINAYKGKKSGKIELSILHKEDEIQDNVRYAKTLANSGDRIKLLPYVNEKGVKNLDAQINGKLADFKQPGKEDTKFAKHSIQNGIKKAAKQGAEIVVFYLSGPYKSINHLAPQLHMGMIQKGKQVNKAVKEVWVVYDQKTVVKLSRKDIETGAHIEKLKK